MRIEITDWMPFRATARRETYAIGDVHGQDDHLAALHDAIAASIEERRTAGAPDALLVHLGDYIDRGPKSLQVLQRAHRGPGIAGIEKVDLMGNHEQFLRLALDGDDPVDLINTLNLWLNNGGVSACASFGVDCSRALANPLAFQAALHAALGPDVVGYLRSLRMYHREERMLFVHAGINPRLPLDAFLATPWDMVPSHYRDEARSPLWIRESFLHWEAPNPEDVYVVHGHSPLRDDDDWALTGMPECRPHRLNLDTGCFQTGRLTAAHFSGSEFRLIFAVG